MASGQSSPWPDLRPELLGLVLGRLPSLADRVRTRAVCHAWHYDYDAAAPQQLLPPPFPWATLLDGTFLNIPGGGEIHRLPLPHDAYCVHGALGNWLFLEHDGGGLSLKNPFSGDVVQLPKVSTIWRRDGTVPSYARRPIAYKLLPLPSSSSLNDDDDISPGESHFAVLITDNSFGNTVSVCRPPVVDTAASFRVPKHERLFHDGKMYAISCRKLFVFRIDYAGDKGTRTRVAAMEAVMDYSDDPQTEFESLSKRYKCAYHSYLVESSGRLLHVRRLVGVELNVPDYERVKRTRTFSFEVFEADLKSCCRWKRVTTLGGQALFVGPYSKSLPAHACGARQDCIYFLCKCDYDQWDYVDPFRDCGVFDMENKVITPLLRDTSVPAVPSQGSKGRPIWFFSSY